jgi:hypothetical protein
MEKMIRIRVNYTRPESILRGSEGWVCVLPYYLYALGIWKCAIWAGNSRSGGMGSRSEAKIPRHLATTIARARNDGVGQVVWKEAVDSAADATRILRLTLFAFNPGLPIAVDAPWTLRSTLFVSTPGLREHTTIEATVDDCGGNGKRGSAQPALPRR